MFYSRLSERRRLCTAEAFSFQVVYDVALPNFTSLSSVDLFPQHFLLEKKAISSLLRASGIGQST